MTDNLDAVLADGTIGAVLLATPHSLHPAQVKACAAAGKQVFCEKPLALHRADAADMFDACRKANVALAVGHSRRFWPSIRALRDIVASGKLGTILHVEGHNSNENSNSVMAGWRLSPEESPGGGLTGAGLHILDAFVSMLGPVRRVYAQFNSREAGPPAIDTAMVMLDFVSGVTGTLATVRATPFYWRVHVFGTKGSAEVLDEGTLVLRMTGKQTRADQLSGNRRLARRARRVRRCDPGQTPVSGAGSRGAGDTGGIRGRAAIDGIRDSGGVSWFTEHGIAVTPGPRRSRPLYLHRRAELVGRAGHDDQIATLHLILPFHDLPDRADGVDDGRYPRDWS